MASRHDRKHSELVRQRIQTSQLINRLQDNALGEESMTAGQIKSAEILLRKAVPDLKQTDFGIGEDDTEINITVKRYGTDTAGD